MKTFVRRLPICIFLLLSDYSVYGQSPALTYKGLAGYWELKEIVDLEQEDTVHLDNKLEFFVIYCTDSPSAFLYRSYYSKERITMKGVFKTTSVRTGLEKMMNRGCPNSFYLTFGSYYSIVFRKQNKEYHFQRHPGPAKM